MQHEEEEVQKGHTGHYVATSRTKKIGATPAKDSAGQTPKRHSECSKITVTTLHPQAFLNWARKQGYQVAELPDRGEAKRYQIWRQAPDPTSP